jgi:YebC/PmpR family DNA-binding regulatory protein
MAGHSKWAQIKRKKAVTDLRRSKEFTRLGRMIASESKRALGDISNPGLRAAIDKARAMHMPKDAIERAVHKGLARDAASLEGATYELYGPGGTAILIEVLTDNKNRTLPELRHLVSKLGFSLAEPGAALWAFQKNNLEWEPHTTIDLAETDAETLLELIEAIEQHPDVQATITNAVGLFGTSDDQ